MKASLEFCAKWFKVIVSCRDLGDIGVGRAVPEDRVSGGGRGVGGLVHRDLLHHMGSSSSLWAAP